MPFLILLLVIAVALPIYFLPSIIAYRVDHKNLLIIFLINFFLGGSLIGWVVALCLALYRSDSFSGPTRGRIPDRRSEGIPVPRIGLPTSLEMTPEQERALAAQVARDDRERFKRGQ